jgi:Rrf2 family iron-sulfur cluster assembly transcriptional regulator
MYGKQTETAIAAISCLAEHYDEEYTDRLSAAQIAKERKLQQPFLAKILTILSQAGLVQGSPGPGGGYALARHPSDIKVYDVYCLFEREDGSLNCPFGGGTCGKGEPCPLHDKLVAVQTSLDVLLHDTTFEAYMGYASNGKKKRTKAAGGGAGKRESYRAPRGRK